MKKLLSIVTFSLSIFTLSGCSVEDGNIADWVGNYYWKTNTEEKWHFFITAEKSKQSEESYINEENRLYPLVIREDKTWFQRNSDKIPTSGYSGTIKCYKDYICFLDMPYQYHIDKDFKFTLKDEYLQYYLNESLDRHALDYDFTIRTIMLEKV